MKVCHFITRLIVGGAQENTFLSARGLVEAGHECVMLTGPSEGREGQLLQKMKNPGFEVVECPLFVREISPFTDLRAILHLKKFLQERKFDVLHTHSSKAGIIGRIAGRMAGVPMVVHTIHGLAFGPYESRLKNMIYINAERYAATKCDRIYAVAQAMIDQCLSEKIGRPEQYQVVYSGMELDRFLEAEPDGELRRSLGIPENRKVVGAIARLFPRKGYEDFFPIASKIVRELPDTHFLILGDGPKRYEYEALTESLGIRRHVTFAGLVSPEEVHRYIDGYCRSLLVERGTAARCRSGSCRGKTRGGVSSGRHPRGRDQRQNRIHGSCAGHGSRKECPAPSAETSAGSR